MAPLVVTAAARKEHAQAIARRAIQRGEITRPEACERCQATGEVHAHHHDYSKPLDVEFLCRSCHRQEHAPPEPSWVARARRLRAEGLGFQAISDALGVAYSTVYKRLNPAARRRYDRTSNERRVEAKRDHARRTRATCDRCGGGLRAGSGHPSRSSGLCATCRRQENDARVALRDRELERLWAEGLKIREIADRLAMTPGHVGIEITRARQRGADLPRRHRRRPAVFPS